MINCVPHAHVKFDTPVKEGHFAPLIFLLVHNVY